MDSKMKIGIIGCGNISGNYLGHAKQFDILEIAACADLIHKRAQAKAAEYGIPRFCKVEELLADPSIEIVLNLTTPDAHASVALAVLEAGKSVYNEKPLAIKKEDAKQMIDIASKKGLRVGGAPDTFLGAGYQTCRKLIDDGLIGKPVGAAAYMLCHGHESWHPDPEFYYKIGGGPMFDMGPYYLTAMVSLLGPVKRVTGSTRISFPERTITSQPKNGTKIIVEVPTHVTGILDFASGAIGTISTSFDVWAHNLPFIEIYGSEGTISAPDPNGFEGIVKLYQASTKKWEEIPLLKTRKQTGRSMGLADMAYAIRSGRPHRANGDMAYHVLDIMHSIHEASDQGKHVVLSSTCPQPAPLFKDLP